MVDVDGDEFFEEDEPTEKIKRAFAKGEKGVTAPRGARGQTQYLYMPRVLRSLTNTTANRALPS
jgi:hypothetical protein